MNNIYDIHIKDSSSKEVSMSKFEGKTLLIVNVASKCGLTPQYKGLQSLYEEYKDRNFVVLGFPCNQFGGQESGSEAEISQFCKINFSVTFPLFAKNCCNPDVVSVELGQVEGIFFLFVFEH